MAIAQAMCTSFKKELMEGVHNFKNSGGDTFKLALYAEGSGGKSSTTATLGATTTAFTTTGEVASSGTYATGGGSLTRVDPTTSGTTAFTDFDDVSYTSASFTANAALIYNTTTDGGSSTTDAVCAIAFGGDKTASNGTFKIEFPANDATAAIIRLA